MNDGNLAHSRAPNAELDSEMTVQLGEAFLQYALGGANWADDTVQGTATHAAKKELRKAWLDTASATESTRVLHFMRYIGTRLDDRCLLHEIRKSCGGVVPEADGTDALVDLITDWVGYVFATTLIPVPEQLPHFERWRIGHQLRTCYGSASYLERVTLKALTDPAIRGLFRTENYQNTEQSLGTRLYDITARIQWNDGTTDSRQAIQLIPDLVDYAVFLMLLTAERDARLAAKYARDAIATLRELVEAGQCDSWFVASVVGIRIDPGKSLDLDDARIVSTRQFSNFVPEIGGASDAVIAVRVKASASTTDRRKKDRSARLDRGAFHTDPESIAEENFRRLNLVRLARTLASSEQQIIVTRVITTTTIRPTNIGSQGSTDTCGAQTRVATTELTAHDLDQLESDYRLVRRLPSNLNLTMRRILLATSERSDPVDGFVDAVIAWENLLGIRNGSTKNLESAIGALLEPADELKRSDVRSDIAKLYNKRSRIVHGDEEPARDEAHKLRVQAILYAIRVVRSILLDDHLRGLKSSGKRNMYLRETSEN